MHRNCGRATDRGKEPERSGDSPPKGSPEGGERGSSYDSCHYAQEANETFGQGRFLFLPGEASLARGCNYSSALVRNDRCDQRGASRDRNKMNELR